MNTAKQFFSYKIRWIIKLLLLVFTSLYAQFSFSIYIIPTDTIIIDGRIVVVEKEEVENLEELPQVEYKEDNKNQHFLFTAFSWAAAPNETHSNTDNYQLIDEFIGSSNSWQWDNFSFETRYGIVLRKNWSLETGISVSYTSFTSTSFDRGELLDSVINNVANHSFEGFIAHENELYQVYREHFDLGHEEREKKLNLSHHKNSFSIVSIPLVLGKNWEINKKNSWSIKGGLLNSFLVSKNISSILLINSSKEYKTIKNLSFRSYLPEVLIETGLSHRFSGDNISLYTGIYGIQTLNSLLMENSPIQVKKSVLGLKIGFFVKF